jgi:HEAT repeat protein
MTTGTRDMQVGPAAATLLRWCEDGDPGVLAELVSVVARAGVPGLTGELARLAGHEATEVRLVVAQALLELQDASPAAVAALVALSRDPVDEVRSWATFGLASDHLAAADGVHAALAARLDDRSEEVRVEAVRGLAVRGDVRAIDAAFELAPQWSGDPIFLDAVQRIQPA